MRKSKKSPREQPLAAPRAAVLFERMRQGNYRRIDGLFASLLALEWFAAIAAAFLISPRAWTGSSSSPHIHLWAALVLGGVIVSLPIAMAKLRPGHISTRYAVAIGQMLIGALLIHLTGGRIETHFHVFGSLAFVSFYRDWKVLLSATAIASLDHFLRGRYWPQSVYGILTVDSWRWVEHLGWIGFEDLFLIPSCLRGVGEMRSIATRQAKLEATGRRIEEQVRARTLDLSKSEARAGKLALIAARTDNAVILTDDHGFIEWVNEGFTRVTGYTLDESLGRSLASVLQNGETDPATLELVNARLQRVESFKLEKVDTTKSGRTYWIAIEVQPIRDESGKLIHYMMIGSDITERKLSENVRARLVTILDATTDLVGIAEINGRMLYMNAAGRKMLGISTDDISETAFPTYFPDWANEQITNESFPITCRDGVWSGELALLRPDGSERPVSMVSLAHKDSQGNVECISTIARDITERKQASEAIQSLNAQLKHRLQHLSALRQIDLAINASFDLQRTLDVVIDQVRSQLHADAVDVMLFDPDNQSFTCMACKGFEYDAMKQALIGPESGVGKIARSHQPLHVSDLTDIKQKFVRAEAMAAEGFRAYSAMPLVSKGKFLGVLEVFQRTPMKPEEDWFEFFKALADQAVIAVDNAMLFEGLQRSNHELTLAYDSTIEGWSRALDLRDKETEGHSKRVTEMTLRLARAFGYNQAELANVRRGALLHDVGKLGIPDAILLKPGALTEDEWKIMRFHPTYAHEWLSPIDFLRPALDIPYSHHEKWDGTGYPRGLAGARIPLSARIFAAVDICDALLSDRPYRKGWPIEKVREHLLSLSGSHLDPHVVELFIPMIGETDIPRFIQGEQQGRDHFETEIGVLNLRPVTRCHA